jgi:hypothetical protein
MATKTRSQEECLTGLVAGFGGCFFVVDDFCDFDFDARFFVLFVLFVVFVLFDFFVVGVVEVAAPDVTRDECLVRCLTVFLPAASAEPPTTSTAIRERTKSVNRLRIITIPPPTRYPEERRNP